MKTERTIKCKRLGIAFSIINWIMCFGLAIGFIIVFASGMDPANESLKEKLGTVIYGIGLSLIPMIVLAILVKDKIRPTVWMIDIILANYLFGSTIMYVTFAIWLVSEYVIGPLARHYRQLYVINKEIDLRQ